MTWPGVTQETVAEAESTCPLMLVCAATESVPVLNPLYVNVALPATSVVTVTVLLPLFAPETVN